MLLKPTLFFLDENVSRRLFNALKKKGLDVVSVKSLKMLGAVNGAVFSEAMNQKRVFITCDSDFLNNKSKEHHGVLVLKIVPRRDSIVIPIVEKFLDSQEIKEINWNQRVILLTEDGFTVIC